MAAKVLTVIPARMDSTRFPGKVLYPVDGRPLIYHLWNRVRKSTQIDQLVIASDSTEVIKAAELFGAETIRTSSRHKTGSDRTAEAARKLKADIVINIQADTFNMRATVLDQVIRKMKVSRSIKYATLVRKIKDDQTLFNPGVVKVISTADDHALWFSRFPLPYLQKAKKGARTQQHNFLAHIGVYFFRANALRAFARWKRGELEKAESLEQLRILENGKRIKLYHTKAAITSIDTPEDLKKAVKL